MINVINPFANGKSHCKQSHQPFHFVNNANIINRDNIFVKHLNNIIQLAKIRTYNLQIANKMLINNLQEID